MTSIILLITKERMHMAEVESEESGGTDEGGTGEARRKHTQDGANQGLMANAC